MQGYRKQVDGTRFAVLFTVFLLLPLARPSAAMPKVQGSFARFVANFNVVAENSGAYVPPTKKEQATFRAALTVLLHGRVARAHTSLAPLNMEIVHFTDTPTGRSFYLLREKARMRPRGWGLYAINLHGTRNLVLEIPHPRADAGTEAEGAAFFLALSARAFLMAGAHRCAATPTSPCSGTTSVCSTAGARAPYRISDAAHSTAQLFHVAHGVLLDAHAALVAVALHGFAQGRAEPHVFVSDGTREVASAANLANQFAERLMATTGLAHAAQSCNDGSAGARLCGTDDLQGRYANGSPDACRQEAPARGRFLHIEQSLDVRTAGGAIESTHVLTVLSQLF